MSTQIKVYEPTEISKGTSAPLSNRIEINGKKREIERIRIDDPSKLDALILQYSDHPDNHGMLSIAVLIAFAVVVISSIVAGVLISPVMVPLILFPGYLAITAPTEYLLGRERAFREKKVKQLEACQHAMRTDLFRTFAQVTLERKEFSIDELLQVHALFNDAQAIQGAARKFEENMSQFVKISNFEI